MDVKYSTETLKLGEASADPNAAFSVRKQVVEDVRALAAWDTTAKRAQEFQALAEKDGWEQAVSQFNRLYGEQAKKDPNDPNVFRMDDLTNVQPISEADLQMYASQLANNPAATGFLSQARAERQFIDRLYTLAVRNGNAAARLPQVLESRANQSYYVIRTISVNQLDQERFRQMKAMLIQREEYGQSQSLAVVHFNPDNILKRMNFRLARPAEPEEGQAQQEAKEASS